MVGVTWLSHGVTEVSSRTAALYKSLSGMEGL